MLKNQLGLTDIKKTMLCIILSKPRYKTKLVNTYFKLKLVFSFPRDPEVLYLFRILIPETFSSFIVDRKYDHHHQPINNKFPHLHQLSSPN
jgi:hypothetical protein